MISGEFIRKRIVFWPSDSDDVSIEDERDIIGNKKRRNASRYHSASLTCFSNGKLSKARVSLHVKEYVITLTTLDKGKNPLGSIELEKIKRASFTRDSSSNKLLFYGSNSTWLEFEFQHRKGLMRLLEELKVKINCDIEELTFCSSGGHENLVPVAQSDLGIKQGTAIGSVDWFFQCFPGGPSTVKFNGNSITLPSRLLGCTGWVTIDGGPRSYIGPVLPSDAATKQAVYLLNPLISHGSVVIALWAESSSQLSDVLGWNASDVPELKFSYGVAGSILRGGTPFMLQLFNTSWTIWVPSALRPDGIAANVRGDFSSPMESHDLDDLDIIPLNIDDSDDRIVVLSVRTQTGPRFIAASFSVDEPSSGMPSPSGLRPLGLCKWCYWAEALIAITLILRSNANPHHFMKQEGDEAEQLAVFRGAWQSALHDKEIPNITIW